MSNNSRNPIRIALESYTIENKLKYRNKLNLSSLVYSPIKIVLQSKNYK